MAHEYTAQLDAMVTKLADRGFLDASAEVQFRDSNGYTPFAVEFSYRIAEGKLPTYVRVRGHDLRLELMEETIEAAFQLANRKIDALPTVREQRIKDFVNQMESLKTNAEDLGLDVDFVNPLMAIMEKLASNALPSPKG